MCDCVVALMFRQLACGNAGSAGRAAYGVSAVIEWLSLLQIRGTSGACAPHGFGIANGSGAGSVLVGGQQGFHNPTPAGRHGGLPGRLGTEGREFGWTTAAVAQWRRTRRRISFLHLVGLTDRRLCGH